MNTSVLRAARSGYVWIDSVLTSNARLSSVLPISTEEYLFLDETDLRVIRSFRDPRKIDSVLDRSSDGGDAASMRLQRSSFEKLSERGVLIADKNVALSVAVDYSFSRDGIPSDMPNPFGEWRANFVDRSADSAARTFNRGHP